MPLQREAAYRKANTHLLTLPPRPQEQPISSIQCISGNTCLVSWPQTEQFWRAIPALWDPVAHCSQTFPFAQPCFACCFTGFSRALTNNPSTHKSLILREFNLLLLTTIFSSRKKSFLYCFLMIIIKLCCSYHSNLSYMLEPYLVISTSGNTRYCFMSHMFCLWICSYSSERPHLPISCWSSYYVPVHKALKPPISKNVRFYPLLCSSVFFITMYHIVL